MQKYWAKRAEVTFDAVKRLAETMGKQQEHLTALWIKESQVLDDDKRTDHFDKVLKTLLAGLTNRHRVPAQKARDLAFEEIKAPGGLDPHCEHCAKNPLRPQTYWDYRRFIDERTFMVICRLITVELDTRQKMALIFTVTEWDRQLKALAEEAKPKGVKH